jgi:hypothetical protein
MKEFRLKPNVKLSVHKILKEISFMSLYCGLDDQGFRVQVPKGKRIFSMSTTPALRPIQYIPGRAASPVVKQPWYEADR